jgi:hypothetical protein
MKVEAEIAAERCVGHGWNVEPGTIISLTIYPKEPQKIDTSSFTARGFDLVVDDTFDEHYTNRISGVQLYVENGNASFKTLKSVRYFPAGSVSKSRCDGFPPFDATSETYSLGDSPFRVKDFDDSDMVLLDDFGFRIRESKLLKGVIFVYFSEKNFEKAKSFRSALIKYARSVLHVPPDRFDVRLGGLRDENMLETFMIWITQPDPVARPKYSSPMVFGRKYRR